MKKILTYASLALILTGSTLSFNSCKKGKDDPFLSFRSRNSRLIGKWKLSKTDGAVTSNSSSTSSTSNESIKSVYDGTSVVNTYTGTDVNSGATTTTNITEKSTIALDMEILKDGTVTITNSSTLTSTTQTTSPANTAPIPGMANSPFGTKSVGSYSVSSLAFDGTYTYGINSTSDTQTGRWYWLESSKSKVNVLIDGLGLFYVKSLKNKTLVLELIDSSTNTTTNSGTSTSSSSKTVTYTFVQ